MSLRTAASVNSKQEASLEKVWGSCFTSFSPTLHQPELLVLQPRLSQMPPGSLQSEKDSETIFVSGLRYLFLIFITKKKYTIKRWERKSGHEKCYYVNKKIPLNLHLVHLRRELVHWCYLFPKVWRRRLAPFSFEGYKVKLCKEGTEVPGVKDRQWSVNITSPLATPTATCFPRSVKQQEGLRSDRKAIVFKNSNFLILKVEGIERQHWKLQNQDVLISLASSFLFILVPDRSICRYWKLTKECCYVSLMIWAWHVCLS